MDGSAEPSGRSIAPVVLLVFNRPDMVRRLMQELQKVRPPELLVVADGPRNATDRENCARVRQEIEDGMNWAAHLRCNYSPTNLGLRKRVSSGLTWAFEQVDRAIILEDDCVPDASFFRFCSELLAYYENDFRVGLISGNNFQPQLAPATESYGFSRYPLIWGWGTWKRSWQYFDNDLTDWPRLRDSGWLQSRFPNPLEAQIWEQEFNSVWEKRRDSWAFAWTYSCWVQNFLTVVPRVNLVSNIGTGETATHTKTSRNLHHLPIHPMAFPLVHPKIMVPNGQADDLTQLLVWGRAKDRSLQGRLSRLVKKTMALLTGKRAARAKLAGP